MRRLRLRLAPYGATLLATLAACTAPTTSPARKRAGQFRVTRRAEPDGGRVADPSGGPPRARRGVR